MFWPIWPFEALLFSISGHDATLTTFLFEIKPNDGISYASVVALLGVMSTLAIYLPARRSSKVEAVIALRAD